AALGFNIRLEDERVAPIPATRFLDLVLREKSPVTVFCLTKKRCKARRRIEPRETKPIDTAIATHERAGLRVAEKRIVHDFCSPWRHVSFAKMDSRSEERR